MPATHEYLVTFEDLECIVFARDAAGAQEAAIDEVEARQGYTTAIVRIRRV
ncbi:hypothetical protein MNJPNG_04850 [Cupriavidus oxalaticus]|uniref:hypothetical protein n=1 Tax=Cupriavidus oxalaticus TaxID=96344 RepID=UPI003F73BB8F